MGITTRRAGLDGSVEVVGPDGPVPFLDLFQGRDELVVYKHMWYDGAPHQGQCEGCTTAAWHLKDAVYLNARGVSFAILTTGRWDEVASFVEFMGYPQPWYSVRGMAAPVGGSMGYLTCFLRDGDRLSAATPPLHWTACCRSPRIDDPLGVYCQNTCPTVRMSSAPWASHP